MMKLIAFIATAALLFAGTKPETKGSVQRIKVHGKSLEGNLEGDSPDPEVTIYLPPGYDANRHQRYPVVYLLHGYLFTDQYWTGAGPSDPGDMPGPNVPAAMDNLIARGEANPMIVVMPNAYTKYAGSMYSSSVTTGDWETYIAEDLVAYIDKNYRTIPDRLSRGLAGHSMGGYGTIRIGMKRPDVFSSLYIMSACCLINNPFPAPPANARQNNTAAATGAAQTASAWAAAFSPNPKNPPLYFDEPYKRRPTAAPRGCKMACRIATGYGRSVRDESQEIPRHWRWTWDYRINSASPAEQTAESNNDRFRNHDHVRDLRGQPHQQNSRED